MKIPRCLFVAALCVLAYPLCANADTAMVIPVTQVLKDCTLTVNSIAWDPVGDGQQPRLDVDYSVSGQGKDYGAIADVRAYNPADMTLLSPSDTDNYGCQIDGLDPRGQVIHLDFTVIDPSAPPKESGFNHESVQFFHVPVPTPVGKDLPCSGQYVSAMGTTYRLYQVETHGPSEQYPLGRIIAKVSVTPPNGILDLVYSEKAAAKITDNKGRVITGGGFTGGKMGSADDPSWVGALPARDARELSFAFDVTESSASMINPKAYIRFGFDVSTTVIKKPPLARYGGAVNSEFDGGMVTANNVTSDKHGNVKLTLYTRDNHPGIDMVWVVAAASITDAAGYSMQGASADPITDPVFQCKPIYWKSQGMPAQAGELGQNLAFTAQGFVPTPPLDLNLQLQRLKFSKITIPFSNIPIPQTGQSFNLALHCDNGLGQAFTITRVDYATREKAFGPFQEHPEEMPASYAGLVFEVTCMKVDRTLQALDCFYCGDDLKRQFTPKVMALNDMENTKAGQQLTYYIMAGPPGPNARGYNLVLIARQTIDVNLGRQVVLHNFPPATAVVGYNAP